MIGPLLGIQNELPPWLEFQRWIPVGVVLALMLLTPLVSQLVRTVWVAGLKKVPINLQRGEQRIDTIIAFVRSIVYFALSLMAFFFTLQAIWQGFDPLTATGALSVIALLLTGMFRELVVDVVKGLDILTGGHYDVGDFVEVADGSGYVVDFKLKYTTLRAPNGQEIVINNARCIPSRRFRHGWITCHVDIPVAAADEQRTRDALDRVNRELNELVELVQAPPILAEAIPLPASGGVALRYSVNVLPSVPQIVAERYLPLVKQTLASAEISLLGEPTWFAMNEVDAFRTRFRKSLAS